MAAVLCSLGLLLTLHAGRSVAPVVLSPTHYDLNLRVDYSEEVLHGAARIVLANLSERPVPEASLLLYRLLRVRRVRGERGANLAFRQAVVAFDDFPKLQVNQILVTFPEPLAPRTSTTIEIEYEGPLLGYAETGMLYVKDRIDPEFTIVREDSYAYPEPGFPSLEVDRSAPSSSFTYSARITVPAGLVVANGGRLDGKDAAGDNVTFRFSSLKPSSRMDFAIAKYGELSATPVRIFYLPGDAAGAAEVAEAAAKALETFSRWFGPPPELTSLSFIEIPDGWGSQADVTTVIQTAAAFRDPKQHREVFHEISHLWNPPDTDRPSPRLNEGLATYLEYLMTQQVSGQPVVDQRANDLLGRLRTRLPDNPDWARVPLVDFGREHMTDLSYSVGALYFDLLYRLAGRDAFNTIIRDYSAGFGRRGGNMTDFMGVVRANAGIDVSRLAADWIYTTVWTERIERFTEIHDLEDFYRRVPR
jgi:aminopeptidase N